MKASIPAVALRAVPLFFVALALAAVVSLWPGQAQANPVSLSYANFPPAPTFPCVQMERWADEVEARTKGQVQIQTYPGSTLLGAKNMFVGVMQGQADIGCVSIAYQPGVFPLTSVLEVPMGFTNATVASMTLWDLYKKQQPKEFSKVKVLTMFTSAPSNIMSKVPVKSLDDLNGLELRASGGASQVLGLLGATPVSMPMPETPEALQKGLVKGLLTSFEVLMDMNFAESCRHETVTNFQVYPFAVIMNLDKWNALPDDVKKVMEDLGREQALWTGKYMDDHVVKSLKWSEEKYGIKVYNMPEADLKAAADKLSVLKDKWIKRANDKGVDSKAVLADVEALKAQYEKEYGK